jgi:2-keto-4-pentenoate hydratase/2-oxohepta-3-ene-1,7-dioic acid hydratase in catechol pathway
MGEKIIDLSLAGEACQRTLPSDMMTFLEHGESALSAAGEVSKRIQDLIAKTGKVTDLLGRVISYNFHEVRLRAPVLKPPKILCLALNYVAHATEGNFVVPEKPYIFIKPGFRPVIGTNDSVFRHPESKNFTYEGELAVVIGQRCSRVPRDKAYGVVAGYTAVNDMSARDLGKTNVNQFDWFRVKAFDSSLPMGPCLTLKDEIEDPHNLKLTVRVNGKTSQEASTGEMVFKIPEIIEFISDYITLDPGDIIATGTPGGSKGALNAGDQVEVEISHIGILRSIVADRK